MIWVVFAVWSFLHHAHHLPPDGYVAWLPTLHAPYYRASKLEPYTPAEEAYRLSHWPTGLAPEPLRDYDWNLDGTVDSQDFFDFFIDYSRGLGDADRDGDTDFDDFQMIWQQYLKGVTP